MLLAAEKKKKKKQPILGLSFNLDFRVVERKKGVEEGGKQPLPR